MLTSSVQVSQWLTSNGVGPGPAETLAQAHKSADAWVSQRVTVPADDDTPEDVVLAVCLMTARYLSRRNSPDGFVGLSEFGPARISRVDQDVASLIGPWRRAVLA